MLRGKEARKSIERLKRDLQESEQTKAAKSFWNKNRG